MKQPAGHQTTQEEREWLVRRHGFSSGHKIAELIPRFKDPDDLGYIRIFRPGCNENYIHAYNYAHKGIDLTEKPEQEFPHFWIAATVAILMAACAYIVQ